MYAPVAFAACFCLILTLGNRAFQNGADRAPTPPEATHKAPARETDALRSLPPLADRPAIGESQPVQPATPPTPTTPSGARKKIVLLANSPDHAWGTHMYMHECRLLVHCLNQTPGINAEVLPEFRWPDAPALPKDAAAIVFYSRSAGDIVLGEAHRSSFLELMKSGAGFVTIHWATKAEDPKLLPEYMGILGGAFHELEGWGLDTSTQPLVQIDPDHPVCRGWKPFDHREEWYLGCKFHEKVHPILKVNVKGKDEVVAWSFDRADGGRSFGTTLGHFHETFTNDATRRAIVNGILWAARAEVPGGGAPVEISEELRTLPPEPQTAK